MVELSAMHREPGFDEMMGGDQDDSDSSDEGARFKVVILTQDARTGACWDVPQNHKHLKTTTVTTSQIAATKEAFILRKFSTIGSDGCSSELRIMQPDLINLLRRVLKAYPPHMLSLGTLRLVSPFYPIIQNWDALEAETMVERGTEGDLNARSDLRLLLSQIRIWSGDDSLDRYMRIRQDLVSTNSITFESLWTIFPQGTLVFSKRFLEQDQVFLVLESSEFPRKKATKPYNGERPLEWELICLTYDWNGKSFDRYLLSFIIPPFNEAKPIVSLPVYPWKYVQNQTEMKEKLVARGSKFRNFCVASSGNNMFRYQGQAIIDRKGFGFVKENVSQLLKSIKDERLTYEGLRWRLPWRLPWMAGRA